MCDRFFNCGGWEVELNHKNFYILKVKHTHTHTWIQYLLYSVSTCVLYALRHLFFP